MDIEPLDQIPLWCFFVVVIVLSILTVEFGYRFGRWRLAHKSEEQETPVAAMVASILGLLAFMLAFTFSMASSRFDARRQVVLEESNSIGTTYLRSQLLPEPQRSEIANRLRQYTANRVQPLKMSVMKDLIEKSDELLKQIWSQAVMAADKDPRSITTGLFLQSLNETIDIHSKRVFIGLRNRIPLSIWIALFSLTLLGMMSIGYQAGLSGTQRSPEMLIMTLSFTLVLYLIVDLDRGQEGFLQVSQQAMIDVLSTMENSKP
jgi:hypothetical protein